VKLWTDNPEKHLKAMKTAWYEWNVAGIKERSDQPGTYLFMRAILTDSEESEESEASQKASPMIPSQVSHHSSKKMSKSTDSITDDTTPADGITDGTQLTNETVAAKNPFFTLDTAS
jgi:hypothetical protein